MVCISSTDQLHAPEIVELQSSTTLKVTVGPVGTGGEGEVRVYMVGFDNCLQNHIAHDLRGQPNGEGFKAHSYSG